MERATFSTRTDTDADGTVVVHAEGDVDIATSVTLRAALIDAVAQSPSLVLDLGDVEFIDSTGLSALVLGHQRAQQAGGTLILRRCTSSVERLLGVTGLDQVLTIENAPA